MLNALFLFHVKSSFLFQISPSTIILLFLKAKLSTFTGGLIFVDELPLIANDFELQHSFRISHILFENVIFDFQWFF